MEKKIVKPARKQKTLTVEQFNALPKAEQRVMIAKDVIAQVLAKKYKATPGTYVEASLPRGVKKDASARENIDKIKKCTVCAFGSCIVSTTRYKNRLTMDEMINPLDNKAANTKLLLTVFTPNQMALIESAFERKYQVRGYWSTVGTYNDGLNGEITEKQEYAIQEFGNRYGNDNDRLIAIMQNIIDNKGKFVP
jgi:hypothetical protein